MFSTNTVWPSVRETPSARSRAMTSVAEPGPVGTMSLIGRLGQLSASAAPASATMAQESTMPKSRFIAFAFVSRVHAHCRPAARTDKRWSAW